MTAQVANTIYIAGEPQDLLADPMAGFFERFPRPPFCARSTANRRGYTTEWELRGNSLYLISLDGMICLRKTEVGAEPSSWCKVGHYGRCAHQEISLADIVGASTDGLFAEWVTDELRVAKGDIVTYVHAGWGSKFECEEYLTFKAGRLVRRRSRGIRRHLEKLFAI